MADRIATLATSNGRLHMINGRDNRRMIDDCFNASPVSVKASLDVLNDLAAQSTSVAILGDIYELGDFSEEGHRQIGRYVAENGINHLITIGQMAEWIADEAARTGCDRVTHFTDVGTALDTISEIVEPQSTVLVKASRGMELERVVELLL
ncbi:glutamate ligase domain-containing protein [Alicyclobacillus fodiniaquatilis]|uniref:Glutamate ligase domain-containing protein n=1 Tax=Alicyclobacillus fodiniaquatilis TaxID=1661150 RepID=A0ABW4JN85_9BACL